jgi:hypothetical protein
VITGFNTDIPFGGVTYHVQTEDKGLKTPLILSLVYVGGTIIASKRTPYADLVEAGYDEGALTERLQRQHKLICAAIRAGRVDDLKKMSGPVPDEAEPSPNGASRKAERKREPERKEAAKAEAAKTDAAKVEAAKTEAAPAAEEVAPEPAVEEAAPEVVEVSAAEESGEAEEWVEALPVEILEPEVAEEELYLTLLEDEGEFRAGQLATIKVQVGHGAYGQRPAPDASVTIKVLGTSFRPLILSTRTDHDGVAVVRALLPRFTSGRAAVIIRAASGASVAELRRIIHQY